MSMFFKKAVLSLAVAILVAQLVCAAGRDDRIARRAKRADVDPSLPDVLLIGDSISIGYTRAVRELLAGKANIFRIPENGGHTAKGLEKLDEWLGDRKWDVIHFNWGLHDLKYIDDKGRKNLAGKQVAPLPEYEKNLRELVERLKKTGAQLIWATTTPTTDAAAGRKPSDSPCYNAVALKVMNANDISVDNLYTTALTKASKHLRADGVHFAPEGSKILAEQVSSSIVSLLEGSGHGEYYVSIRGNDSNSGTMDKPFRTIQKAVWVMESGDTCFIRDGRYSETVTVKDVKGQEDSPIVLRPYGNEKVVLDGSEPIEAKWSVYKGRIHKARIGQAVRQLFVEGKSMCSARWPNGNWDDGSVWDKSKCMAWPEEANSDFGHHYNKGLAAFDFSLEDGGIVIVNSGSFRTYKAFVTEHKAGSDNFKYDTTNVKRHFGAYPVSKHGYFIEGKLGLLDVPGEWFYEPRDSTLYLWPLDGRNPNDLEIRGKIRSYAFDIEDSSYITIKGLHFFGATFRSSESTHITVEDCNFLYPSYSNRMLRDLSLIDVTKMTIKKEFDPAHNTVRNCVLEYMDGPALKMNGVGNVIENCYIHDVDYSCTYEGGWTINTVDSPELVFRRNTVHTTGASELFKAGVRNVIEYNDLSRSGFLQNDGGLIQISVKSQKDSVTQFNWVHDSVKQGIRFDNSNKPGSPWGEGGRVHHNVAWKTERVFFKGDRHFIHNNLLFGSRANDLIISSNKEINGFNYETITRNNIAGTFSGHRTKPGRDYPVPGVVDHNWTADVKGKDIRTQLRNPDNLDFRPRARSQLVDSGVPMKGYDFPYVGKAPDVGPYEYGDENYWIPGRQWSEASRPVPPDGAGNVKLDADLMWLGGYRADSHDVYFGTDWKVVCSAGRTSRWFKGNQRNNIYGPGELEPKTPYYWRIDVMKDSSVVKGSVWSFTTGVDNVPGKELVH